MSKEKKQAYTRLTTPRGVFVYPRLTEPDTKFVKPDGEYHTKFMLDADEESTEQFTDKLVELLEEYIKSNPDELKPAVIKKAGRDALFEVECDDEGVDTGRLSFKFKLKARVITKTKSWDQKPRLFDAAAQPIADGDVSPWTGTEGKVNIEVFPYYMQSSKNFGLSLRLVGAQILKLVEGSGGPSAEDMGFGAEDGYTSSAADSGFDAEEGADAEDGGEF